MIGVARFALRSLLYYWRTHLAAVLGVAIAVAALSGARVVGTSVRESLRALAEQRLGRTDVVVGADRFFREELAAALAFQGTAEQTTACPMIQMPGTVTRDGDRRQSHDAQVYGVDARFWQFHGVASPGADGDAGAFVSPALARAGGIARGDELLIRIESVDAVPKDLLFGQREAGGRTIRIRCGGIVPAAQMGEFSLKSGQGDVRSVFIPLSAIQRNLRQRGRANTVLVSYGTGTPSAAQVRSMLAQHVTPADLGLRVRRGAADDEVAVESERILLDEASGRAAVDVARESGWRTSGVFSYLVNDIRARERSIPYSAIAAADLGKGALTNVRWIEGGPTPEGAASDDSIWLNEWASKALGVTRGDRIEIEYFRWEEGGRLTTARAAFALAGIVAIEGAIGPWLAPVVPGVSDASDMRGWEPPFPVDLRRIRPADEDYWHRFRATPKAFVTLARGQELWRTRFGQLTSVRLDWSGERAAAGESGALSPDDVTTAIGTRLAARIDPAASGFAVVPVREKRLGAASGTTDFGEYFLYFSVFLLISAVLLAALFFRLGVEQRAKEIGLLQSVGYGLGTIRLLFVAEGVLLASVGAAIGSAAAVSYGWLLLAGLRTWWIGAIGTSAITLHATPRDFAEGVLMGIVAAVGAVLWALRGVGAAAIPARLAGTTERRGESGGRPGRLVAVAIVGVAVALLLAVGSFAGLLPAAGGYFGAGSVLLLSLLFAVKAYLRRLGGWGAVRAPRWPLLRLTLASAAFRPGRSLLSVALVAMATFVIVSVGAFRKDAVADAARRTSGTGGFALVGQTAAAVIVDPGTGPGREALGLSRDGGTGTGVTVTPFRVRPGDDASCLNLYAPREPRILGAQAGFIRAGRFAFQRSLANAPEQRQNPWLLLEVPLPNGVIPAIADANTIEYSLHKAVGDIVVVPGDDGVPVQLKLVAALSDSILQGEVIISEAAFLRRFPTREGYRFFLFDAPMPLSDATETMLDEQLTAWGPRIERAADRLAMYRRVENTYLETFQLLGLLGLMLGTAGMAAMLLRNVLERRRELAMLQAVGFSRGAIAAMTVIENLLLVVGGLVVGSASAMVATAPALVARGIVPALGGMLLLFALELVTGLCASLAAVAVVVRMPVLASLRSE